MKKIITFEEKINALPRDKYNMFWDRYEQESLKIRSAWACWIFGFHYIHTKQYGLFMLYLLSCIFYVGFIRWIIQGFQLKDNIEEYNDRLQHKIYLEVKFL